MNRRRYLLKRVAYSVAILLAVITLVFLWYRISVFEFILGEVSGSRIEAGEPINRSWIHARFAAIYNVDPVAPLHEAYLDYLHSMFVERDLGVSFQTGSEPVFELLVSSLPWTIFIEVNGLLLGFLTELVMRTYVDTKDDSRVKHVLTSLTYFSNAVPYYLVAIVGLSMLSFEFGILPVGGRYGSGVTPGFNLSFILGLFHYAALPLATAYVAGFGVGLLRQHATRRDLSDDIVRYATIRGVSRPRLLSHYRIRSAVTNVHTNLFIGISVVFSSSVIIERLFDYPGIGWYIAVTLIDFDFPDFSLAAGGLIFYTALTLIAWLILDVVYLWLDPSAVVDGEGISGNRDWRQRT